MSDKTDQLMMIFLGAISDKAKDFDIKRVLAQFGESILVMESEKISFEIKITQIGCEKGEQNAINEPS